ncbi:MAG: hypothetical protein K2N78_08685 [Oscillospiraceae bacterium]|nr:hypothetical protein [Oscillospiraceae bacterium]
MPDGGTDHVSAVLKEAARLTQISNAAYWGDTSNVTIVMSEQAASSNMPPVVPEVIMPPAELRAAAEAERLTEISNAAYADYSEAVYNNAAYNTVNRADYTAYASPLAVFTSASEAVETVPSPGGGGFDGPIKVEVHIHLEGNATPEVVQLLEDVVHRGELQEAVADAMENIQADALRGAYV